MHGGGMGGMMGGYQGYGYGFGALEGILWVALIGVIAWLAYYVAKSGAKESRARDLLLILGAVLFILFLSSFGGGMMFGWMFMWLPIVVLVVLLVILLGKGGMREHKGSAIEVLDKRYARGEISREEYLRMKGEIEK